MLGSTSKIVICINDKGSRKKCSFLNGSAIKALPPPPHELNGSKIKDMYIYLHLVGIIPNR